MTENENKALNAGLDMLIQAGKDRIDRDLAEFYEERELEQLKWIYERAIDYADFNEALNIFGLDPSKDRLETKLEKHLRRQLS